MNRIRIFSRLLFAVLLFSVVNVTASEAGNESSPPASIARPQQDIGAESAQRVNSIWEQVKEDVARGHDWSDYAGKSVKDKKEPAKEDTTESKGSATSGKVAYTGPSSLTAEYYYGCNSGGNIFQQLACRAGQIGLGLRSVGYIIAGFGLLVFSFAALFGKVKWNVFATIMFSVFLLSMTFFVINTFTKDGNSAWIAGIAPTGYDSAEKVYAPTKDADGVSVPDVENNRPN